MRKRLHAAVRTLMLLAALLAAAPTAAAQSEPPAPPPTPAAGAPDQQPPAAASPGTGGAETPADPAGAPAEAAPAPAAVEPGAEPPPVPAPPAEEQPVAPPAALPAAPPPEPYVEPTPPAPSPAASGATGAVDLGPGDSGDEGDEANEKKLAWRGTLLLWDHAITKNTLDPGAQLSYNPTYVQTLSLRPRWYFSDSLSIGGRQDLAVELTDSDGTTEKQQWLFADTRIDVTEGKLAEWQKIVLRLRVTARLPLSLASQAEERIAALGPDVRLARKFDVLDALYLNLNGGYRHNFSLSNVRHTVTPFPCTRGVADCDQASGLTNVRDVFSASLSATLAFLEQFAFGIEGGNAWQLGRELADDALVGPDASPTHWRNVVEVSAALSYQPVKWLGLDLGVATATAHTDIGGAAGRNPLWNPDTSLSLTLSLLIDEIYLETQGRGSSPAPVGSDELAGRGAPHGT